VTTHTAADEKRDDPGHLSIIRGGREHYDGFAPLDMAEPGQNPPGADAAVKFKPKESEHTCPVRSTVSAELMDTILSFRAIT